MQNLQVLNAHSVSAHSAGHPDTFGDPSSRAAAAAANSSWLAFRVLLAVGPGTAGKAVSFHHALEALAFGDSAHYDRIALLELGNINLVSLFKVAVIHSEFSQVSEGGHVFQVS